jgi:hypothetical protein
MSQRAYVYYRVRARDEALAVAALRALQAAWATSQPGVRCELLRRADESESDAPTVTLMEVYAFDAGVSPAQRQGVQDQAAQRLAAWRLGERNVERFEPCA